MSDRAHELRRIELPPDEAGRAREALLILAPDGRARAYLNRCPHLDVPLDAGTPEYAPKRGELICQTHGARFRVLDGLCTWGPCHGDALLPVEVERNSGGLCLVFEGARLQVD